MGGIIELLVIMLIIATVAFAPLGYFIHKYTQKNAPSDAKAHSDHSSFVNDLAENAIQFVKSKLSKK